MRFVDGSRFSCDYSDKSTLSDLVYGTVSVVYITFERELTLPGDHDTGHGIRDTGSSSQEGNAHNTVRDEQGEANHCHLHKYISIMQLS